MNLARLPEEARNAGEGCVMPLARSCEGPHSRLAGQAAGQRGHA